MYNKDIKERFLKECYKNEDTREVVALTFIKIAKLEEQFNTDLMNVNLPQLESILRRMRAPNKNALGKSYNYMQKYYTWSYKHRLCGMNMAFSNISRKNLEKYLSIDKVQNQYIKERTELYSICDNIYNAVDRAIIVLLYEGVSGEDLIELRELRKDDVKIIAREIHITSGEHPRILTNVDERTMAILEETINEDEYYTNNGESVAKAPKRYMIDSDYIIRPTKMHNQDGEPISNMGISVRMSKIKKWTEKYYLTPTNIVYSGIFEKLAKIEEEHELGTIDYRNVLLRFGFNPESYAMLKERYETYKRHR